MCIYGCLDTRREPFTTKGRPLPQGGYIQSTLPFSFLSLFRPLSQKLLSLKNLFLKKKWFPPKQTEIHALKQDGFLTAQPMRQPQSFFCKHRGKSFKVCCRHRTAGLGSMKSGLLHRYTQVGGNIRKVVRTPFHIFVPSGPVDGRKYVAVKNTKIPTSSQLY